MTINISIDEGLHMNSFDVSIPFLFLNNDRILCPDIFRCWLWSEDVTWGVGVGEVCPSSATEAGKQLDTILLGYRLMTGSCGLAPIRNLSFIHIHMLSFIPIYSGELIRSKYYIRISCKICQTSSTYNKYD